VARIQQVFVDTGAVRAIEASIDALTNQAIAAIKVADVTDEARGALVDLAQFVAWRAS
jgi:geranylgeranyl pyrophosphate synthase